MEKNEQAKEQIWVCDALEITHCEVGDEEVVYTVTYVDFKERFKPMKST